MAEYYDECRGCGALLPPPDGDGHRSCLSCGRRARPSLLHRGGSSSLPPPSLPSPTLPPPPVPRPGEVWVDRADTATSGRPNAARAATAIGCGIPVAITVFLLIASVVALGVINSSDDPTPRGLIGPTRSDKVTVIDVTDRLSVEQLGDDVAVAVVQRVTGSDYNRSVAGIVLDDRGTRTAWETEPLGRHIRAVEAAVIDDVVFVSFDDRLLAIEAASGAVRWDTRLPDDVAPTCQTCVSTAGDRLIVQTADGTVTAFATASAEPRWSRQLDSPFASVVTTDSFVVIVDEPDAGSAVTAEAVDPADGFALRSLTVPCADRQVSLPATVRAVPDSDDVLAVFGSLQGCAVVWDATTATTRSEFTVPDDVGVLHRAEPVFDGRDVVLAGQGALVVADLDRGTTQVLTPPEGVTTVASVVVADDVILNMTTAARGTPVGGIAAWDRTTGDLRWSHDLTDRTEVLDPRVDPDTVYADTPRATLVHAGGVALATFTAGDAPTVALTPIDLTDGTLDEPKDHLLDGSTNALTTTVVSSGPDRFVFTVGWDLYWISVAEDDLHGPFPT